jgi:hypothetical protein
MFRLTHFCGVAPRLLRDRRHVRSARVPRPTHRRRLSLQQLEDRRLLTVTVDTLLDEADGSIVDGDVSLRDAVALVTAGDTIDFAPALNGGTIDLTLGQISIRRAMTIDASGLADGLTVDASVSDPTPDTNNRDGRRVLSVNDNLSTNAEVLLRGLTLTGGDVNGNGGAIDNRETLTIVDSTITDNSASFGGGIHNTGILSVESSEITGNRANFGGGLRNGRLATVTDSSIADNRATQGGGVFNFGNLTVTDSIVSGNAANSVSGGGLINSGRMTIVGVTIVENSARFGGGIRNANNGTLSIVDSSFLRNSATEDGGGI